MAAARRAEDHGVPEPETPMAHLDAYLFFDGTCADAMRFYERVFHGRLEVLQTYAESPAAHDVAPDRAQRIMHARLVIDGRALLASDAVSEDPFEGIRGFALSMNYDTVDEAQRVFAELGDGGTVQMPLQQTFWAQAFGMLVDRFGTPWMVNVNAAGQDDASNGKVRPAGPPGRERR
jgi:PhnB protein